MCVPSCSWQIVVWTWRMLKSLDNHISSSYCGQTSTWVFCTLYTLDFCNHCEVSHFTAVSTRLFSSEPSTQVIPWSFFLYIDSLVACLMSHFYGFAELNGTCTPCPQKRSSCREKLSFNKNSFQKKKKVCISVDLRYKTHQKWRLTSCLFTCSLSLCALKTKTVWSLFILIHRQVIFDVLKELMTKTVNRI